MIKIYCWNKDSMKVEIFWSYGEMMKRFKELVIQNIDRPKWTQINWEYPDRVGDIIRFE